MFVPFLPARPMPDDIPVERRRRRRREEDVGNEPHPDVVLHGWVKWVVYLAANRAKLVAIAGLLGVVLSALGFHYISPSDELKAIRSEGLARDSMLRLRLGIVEHNQDDMRDALDGMRAELQFQNYLSCTNLKRTDPAAVPPSCDSYGRPLAAPYAARAKPPK